MIKYTRVLGAALLLWSWTTVDALAESCSAWLARAVSVQGAVEAKRASQGLWTRVQLQDQYCAGDTIRTDAHSRAAFVLRNETILRMDQRSTLALPESGGEDFSWLELLQGALHLISNVPYELKIKTPFVNAAIEGTEFALRVSEQDTRVWVVEGQVLVENSEGQLRLGPGKAALAERDKAPAPYLKVSPHHAVQWTLYYPAIIDFRKHLSINPERERATSLFRGAQVPAAIAALNELPTSARDASFYSLRAAFALAVGDIESARPDLDQAILMAPHSGEALALKSMIALVRNEREQAGSLADEAVRFEAQSPAPYIARSYVQQAAFDLDAAKESIKTAVELAPDDALAWARLSELELSTGNLDEALEAARKAESLDPELAHTQMVLGFASLLQSEIDAATQSFNKAIELDPSAPLPRLGLGLAKIRAGNVEEGAKDLEVAAILDPENSLVRSYLGKAYFDEKRDAVVSRELDQAKRLDPKDPTPWFYDAIHKQTTNRPVEALHDMQKAIELNDQRAVYRSRLLLDDDLAARSSALGRIYNDLGFQSRGMVEAWRSINSDPGNYSAHRLLADNYAGLPRQEIARVSELLQSQMLQPVNLTPVQPNLAETNLVLVSGSGPSSAAFNEFNPLFQQNRFALQTSGIAGFQDTYGDEVTHSGVWNQFSYSLGQLHYQTHGFRENNEINANIYNGFVQARLLPELSLQAEYRHREVENGNLDSIFFPTKFDEIIRNASHNESISDHYRLGLNYSAWNRVNFLSSFTFIEKNDANKFFPGAPASFIDSQGYFTDSQVLYRDNLFNLTAGGGYYLLHQTARFGPFRGAFSTRHNNGYLYSITRFPSNLSWTFGLSGDVLHSDAFVKIRRRLNPKVGLMWNISGPTVLRAAWFKTLKRSSYFNQGLEPTQVAGFNQLFDDFTGTVSERWGVGLDSGWGRDFTGGVEYSERDLSVPYFRSPEARWFETLFRSYLQYTPHPRWATKVEYSREFFQNLSSFGPFDTLTQVVPASVSYFDPSGFFTKFQASYFNQEVMLERGADSDEAVFLDLSLGYRLPKRYGIFEIRLQNLLNQGYRYESLQGRQSQERNGVPTFLPFPPEFTGSARLTLAFY